MTAEVVHVDLDTPEARHEEAVERMIAVHIGADASIRMTERCEGRYGIGGHNSGVGIVFANQSLWGVDSYEALVAAIHDLVRTDPHWRAHYEQRARAGLEAAQKSYDAFLAAMTDEQRADYRRRIDDLIARKTAERQAAAA